MRNSRPTRNLRRLAVLCAGLFALTAMPLLSSARSSTTATTAVIIVNNSNRSIRNVYLSHVDVDDWGTNQLGETIIAPGQSFTLGNLACDQQQVKVIGEDQEGCFLATVVSCGESATWTITNDTAADCGQ